MFSIQTLLGTRVKTGRDPTKKLDLASSALFMCAHNLARASHEPVHGADMFESLKAPEEREVATKIQLQTIDLVAGQHLVEAAEEAVVHFVEGPVPLPAEVESAAVPFELASPDHEVLVFQRELGAPAVGHAVFGVGVGGVHAERREDPQTEFPGAIDV